MYGRRRRNPFYVYYYYSYNNLPNIKKYVSCFFGTMSLALKKKCILNFCVCHNIHVPSLFVYIFIQVKKKKKENYEQISLI